MNETRQFLRYLVPATVFYLYVGIFFAVTLGPTCPADSWKHIGKFAAPEVVALLVFFGGGIGYLLSALHHFLYNTNYSWYQHTDYRNFLAAYGAQLERRVLRKNGMEDWVFINVAWHTFRGRYNQFEALNQRNDSLSDILHGAGTALVSLWAAALLTFLTSITIFLATPDPFSCLHGISLMLAIIGLLVLHNWHEKNFFTAITKQREFVEAGLLLMLKSAKQQKSKTSRR